ncbi:MAG: hypothetical protein ACT4O2_11125 [Beijerinckiaceae bacterium]
MAAKEIAVKKFVSRRSRGGCSRRKGLIRTKSNLARRLRKARIFLKADAKEAYGGWSRSHVFEEWTTSAAMVYGVRMQQVEDDAAAVLSRALRKKFPRFSTAESRLS